MKEHLRALVEDTTARVGKIADNVAADTAEYYRQQLAEAERDGVREPERVVIERMRGNPAATEVIAMVQLRAKLAELRGGPLDGMIVYIEYDPVEGATVDLGVTSPDDPRLRGVEWSPIDNPLNLPTDFTVSGDHPHQECGPSLRAGSARIGSAIYQCATDDW